MSYKQPTVPVKDGMVEIAKTSQGPRITSLLALPFNVSDAVAVRLAQVDGMEWLEQVIAHSLDAPAPEAAAGVDQQNWKEWCESLIDIWDDAKNNPPEQRCYLDGAFSQEIDHLRAAIATQPKAVDSVALNLEAQLRAVVRERDELRIKSQPKAAPTNFPQYCDFGFQCGSGGCCDACHYKPKAEVGVEALGSTCIDGGKCHHECKDKCFRREYCAPFSDYTGPWAYVKAAPVAEALEPVGEEKPSGQVYGIIDPDYGRIYTIIRKLAWEEGYAIGLHGSFTRDLDLIAVPWGSIGHGPEHLVRRIVASNAGLREAHGNPGEKPHGRKVWTLLLEEFGDPRFVDLSIMPHIAPDDTGAVDLRPWPQDANAAFAQAIERSDINTEDDAAEAGHWFNLGWVAKERTAPASPVVADLDSQPKGGE